MGVASNRRTRGALRIPNSHIDTECLLFFAGPHMRKLRKRGAHWQTVLRSTIEGDPDRTKGDSGLLRRFAVKGTLIPVLFAGWFAVAGLAPAQTLDLEVSGLAGRLSKALVDKGAKNIAAIDFTDLQGQPIRYSPEELEFFMIALKEGVEFQRFARCGLPHARVISVSNDPEFALNVLRGLDAEMENRGRLFTASGATKRHLASTGPDGQIDTGQCTQAVDTKATAAE